MLFSYMSRRRKLLFLCQVARAMLLILFYIFACAGESLAGETLPPLFDAESMVNDGPEALSAIFAMKRDAQLEELERQRTGVRYFLNASLGYSDEPLFETSDESNSYTKATVGAGFVFPLFGTWTRQKVGEIEAEIRSVSAKYRPRIIELHNLAALRKAYVTLWAECEKIRMSKRFLSTEQPVSAVLAKRQGAGLILPADRLEFMTAYDMARRDIAVSELRKTQALQIIRLATGHLWSMPDAVDLPTLPDFNGLSADMDGHPEMLMRREILSKYEKLCSISEHGEKDGALTVGVTAAKDFPGEIGTGVYASVSVSEPLKMLKSGANGDYAAAGQNLKAAEKESLFMRIKIEGEAEETVALAGYAAVNIKAQEARLAAMSESVRERIMRHASIGGDTFEQLQKSRYQYYRAALDMIDSEMIFMQTGADLLSYAYPAGRASEPAVRFNPISENGMRSRLLDPDWLTSDSYVPGGSAQIKPLVAAKDMLSTTLPGPEQTTDAVNVKKAQPEKTVTLNSVTKTNDAAGSSVPYSSEEAARAYMPKSVYVWDAKPFLAPNTRMENILALQKAGFSHILLSLNASQIEALDSYYNRTNLDALLSLAKRSDIRVDLLLGEPSWLMPEERPKLLDIVRKLSSFNFQGVHLDIEPDSLPDAEANRRMFLKELIATVSEVKSVTDLPLSISLHPRYLEGDFGVTLNEGISRLGLEYISVMLYSTNPDVTANRLINIMLMHPGLNIYLAQSVENGLPPDESYMPMGFDKYSNCMAVIGKRLYGSGCFKGIIIQSWEDYRRMRQ